MTKKSQDPEQAAAAKPATTNSTALRSAQPDYARLYQLLLAEERRLRLWLSHIARDFPDNSLALVAKQALAGQDPPKHKPNLSK